MRGRGEGVYNVWFSPLEPFAPSERTRAGRLRHRSRAALHPAWPVSTHRNYTKLHHRTFLFAVPLRDSSTAFDITCASGLPAAHAQLRQFNAYSLPNAEPRWAPPQPHAGAQACPRIPPGTCASPPARPPT